MLLYNLLLFIIKQLFAHCVIGLAIVHPLPIEAIYNLDGYRDDLVISRWGTSCYISLNIASYTYN